MADVKHFDVDVALDRMLQVFWHRGFKSATTKELAQSAGLSEGSLFNTFGSKQAVYKKVLQRYVDHNRHLLQMIEQQESPLAGLRQYWETIAGNAANRKRSNGCMITNAAVSESADKEIAAFVKTTHRRNEKAFRRALDKAVEIGELKPGTDTEALAQFLLHSTQGIRALSPLSPPKKKMQNIVNGVMSVLDQHRVNPKGE